MEPLRSSSPAEAALPESVPPALPEKLLQALPPARLARLSATEIDLLRTCAGELRFSFQQVRQSALWLEDCTMWGEDGFRLDFENALALWRDGEPAARRNPRQFADRLFRRLEASYKALAGKAKAYPETAPREELPRPTYQEKELKGRIFKLCPAASEKAVCCNLKVLSIVENCAMACSYCVLQTHYDEPVIAMPVNLKEKLAEIELNPAKRYRIGTGEYSDSLLWGNKNGILEDLAAFAARHPNIILELKTKSANIGWVLENEVPPNLCCSWSLNPPAIVANEEHRTASLDRRLEAARRVADKGVKVAFHIHPMFYFEGWEEEYQTLIRRLLDGFRPSEVLWVSLGCVTLVKGFAAEFRERFRFSKLLQMETEVTPDGKTTYAAPVREALYRNALAALAPWKGQVFQYLCMEHAPLWDRVMGFHYPSMGAFDEAFNEAAFPKL